MNNVKCIKCLQKHLALCKSYAREVLDGHGQGGNPDHRDDIDGEITNAEIHASLIDGQMQLKIRNLRRIMQSNRFIPTSNDLETLSILYHYCDKFNGISIEPDLQAAYDSLPATNLTSNVLSSDISSGCGCSK